jgi:putative DNA-invertase from lambdoid prophage Rac
MAVWVAVNPLARKPRLPLVSCGYIIVWPYQLGGTDLTSAAGRMTMNVLAAVAQFERDLLIERTQSGLQRAWAEGKKSGRRASLDDTQRAEVRAALEAGATVSALARQYETSRQTILRAKGNGAAA